MSLDQVPQVVREVAADADATGKERRHTSRGGRRSQRGVRRGPRRRRRALAAAGALVGVGAIWWAGWASPLTAVEHVVVDAPSGISEKAVRKASGIAATDHVPAVNGDLVRTNVMDALPAVAAVEVQRSLPDTITLTVTARTPFAALPRGDRYAVIDASGVQFDHVRSPGKLPVIRALSYEGLRSAQEVLVSLPPELVAEVRTVNASTHHDIDLRLASGATVRWGSPDQPALKARVLAGLRSVKAARYDVSAPLMPTTSG